MMTRTEFAHSIGLVALPVAVLAGTLAFSSEQRTNVAHTIRHAALPVTASQHLEAARLGGYQYLLAADRAVEGAIVTIDRAFESIAPGQPGVDQKAIDRRFEQDVIASDRSWEQRVVKVKSLSRGLRI